MPTTKTKGSARAASARRIPTTKTASASARPIDDHAAETINRQLRQAVALQQSGDIPGAQALFEAVLALDPGQWAARYSMASICSGRGEWATARDHALTGLKFQPGHPKLTEALAQVERALSQAPRAAANNGSADPDWNDLMQVVRHCEGLGGQGRSDEAMAVYRRFLAEHTGGLGYVGLFNLSVLQAQAGQKVEAEASMRQAIRIKPDFFPAHLNLGTLLEGQGRQDDAVQAWTAALEMPEVQAPEHLDVHVQLCNNLGRLLEIMRRYDEAEAALARSLKAKPGQTPAISHWLHLRQKMCKWPAWHGLGLSRDEVLQHASALGMMALSDDPQQQLDCARRFVTDKVGVFERMVPKGHRYGHDRIRIGFLSSDLSMHAVSLLTVEMFEKFDRSKVEVHAFCWSKEDGTAFRERVRSAFDVFHKIGHLSDEEAARLIVDSEIDVVFDLQGITSGARPNIVARGPAPLQIAYLGYVGTSALPHVDHVIADQFIFPQALRPFFTEEPLMLPFFQVSDSQRVMGTRPTRSQFGLPQDAFVFCAFNNNYKITPEVFASWMRILRRVPGGVLWLLEDNPWSRENLRHAAMVHGVEPHRLHFTGRIDPRDYLARFTVADLFLDTHPYGAGTTANDALWAGLPVLTMPGRTYVSRMAGACLHRLGLDALISKDAEDYENRAVELSGHAERLSVLRQQLQAAHPDRLAFDTAAFVTDLTSSLEHLLREAPQPASIAQRGPVGVVANGADVKRPGSVTPSDAFDPLRLLVRGWRGINHSYALVNQYQLSVLDEQADVRLQHQDMPLLAHWKATADGSGFDPAVAGRLQRLPNWDHRSVDVAYSIFSPLQPFDGMCKADVTFMVTEFGPTPDTFAATGGSGRVYTQGKRHVVTPSNWSRRKLIEAGLDEKRIVVIPHGVDCRIFQPASAERRRDLRAGLDLHEEDFVLLNIGGAFWNKGIDRLVAAYAALKPRHPRLKLILKDNRQLYARTVEEIIAQLQGESGLTLPQSSLNDIKIIPGTLNLLQLADLYAAADLYASPYRAEGFNLPVLEAMACGLRCVVTEGGATDDFFLPQAGRQIRAIPTEARPDRSPVGGDYLEPDLDALIDALDAEMAAGHSRWNPSGILTWQDVSLQLLEHLRGLALSETRPAAGARRLRA